jgi:hypothetical protein
MRRTDPVHQRLPLRNGRNCKAKLSVASIFKNALLNQDADQAGKTAPRSYAKGAVIAASEARRTSK